MTPLPRSHKSDLDLNFASQSKGAESPILERNGFPSFLPSFEIFLCECSSRFDCHLEILLLGFQLFNRDWKWGPPRQTACFWGRGWGTSETSHIYQWGLRGLTCSMQGIGSEIETQQRRTMPKLSIHRIPCEWSCFSGLWAYCRAQTTIETR